MDDDTDDAAEARWLLGSALIFLPSSHLGDGHDRRTYYRGILMFPCRCSFPFSGFSDIDGRYLLPRVHSCAGVAVTGERRTFSVSVAVGTCRCLTSQSRFAHVPPRAAALGRSTAALGRAALLTMQRRTVQGTLALALTASGLGLLPLWPFRFRTLHAARR